MGMTQRFLASTFAGLKTLGITDLSDVQNSVLEASKSFADIIVQSRAGTGKSTSIGLVISELCEFGGTTLVLCPNSKLVLQNVALLRKILSGGRCRVAVPESDCISEIPADFHAVIVGEPEEILSLNLPSHRLPVQKLIFDEADELFEGQQLDACRTIVLRFAKPSVKTLFLSATFPPNIVSRIEEALSLADSSRVDPPYFVKLCTSTSTDRWENPVVPHVKQFYSIVENSNGFDRVVSEIVESELMHDHSLRCIIFGGRNRQGSLPKLIAESGRTVEISSSTHRIPDSNVIFDPAGYLSRGVNIPNLNIGISISIPDTKEELLHQWGRIAREGKPGRFIMVLERDEINQLEYLSFQLGVEFEEYSLFPRDTRVPFEIFPSTEDRFEYTERLISFSVG